MRTFMQIDRQMDACMGGWIDPKEIGIKPMIREWNGSSPLECHWPLDHYNLVTQCLQQSTMLRRQAVGAFFSREMIGDIEAMRPQCLVALGAAKLCTSNTDWSLALAGKQTSLIQRQAVAFPLKGVRLACRKQKEFRSHGFQLLATFRFA